jgi:RNA polymerase sigma factor (sigma-70 family)
MSRAHAETRVSEQIRTLFQAGSLGALTDGQLLDRYLAPDGTCSEMAFAAIVERHGPMVLGVCRRLLGDAHLADDAFQAAFLVLARRARTVRNQDSLGGWLHRVARRIAMRLRRAHERRKTRERPGNLEAAVQDPDHAVQNELKSAIDQEIDRLAESHRLPVVLCCLEGISHEEAAQRLCWPLGTVKSRLARGKKRLQARLVRKGFAPSAALAAAAGTGLLGTEASAAVPPALIDATAKAAAAVASGASLAGVVPAPLSALVGQELNTMIASRLTLALLIPLAAGASAVFIGFILAAAPSSVPEASPLIPAAAPQNDRPQGKAEPAATAVKLSASGTVTDQAGQPIAGARVILREWSVYRVREMPREETKKFIRGDELHDTLMETTTDDAGRFRFDNVTAPAFPHIPEAGQGVYPWDIVALAQGHGLAWVQLTPQHQRAPITLKLGPEKMIRGRVIEPGGKPVAGAKISIHGIDPLGRPVGNGLQTENRLNLIWSAFPLGTTTDADGRFTVARIPPDQVATLVVTESRHERLAVFVATTEKPQPENVATYYPYGQPREVRDPVYTGELLLTAKLANHVLKGRVIIEADGKPAAGAYVLYHGSSFKTDENGRFRIDGLVAGKIELQASHENSSTAPLVAQIEIPETPTEIERAIALPPGLVITGRVVDEATGQPVAKAQVDFTPAPDPNQSLSLFALWKDTGIDGKFRLVLPPGRGTIFLRTIPNQFTQPERKFTGQPTDPRFNREVSGTAGQTVDVGDFKLSAGRTVVLRVVDPDGQPVPDAEIFVRDPTRMFDKTGPAHSDAQGQSTLGGLASEASTVVDIIAAKRSLGATVEIPDPASAGANNREIEARLQPLLSLTGRVLDDAGKPIAGPIVYLYRNVIYPGQSARSFGLPVGTLNDIKGDGMFTFRNLIPGATYNTQVQAGGYPNATSAEVTPKPGGPVRLDDFRLPVADQNVSGIVVDTRGKPLEHVSVSLQRNYQGIQMYAPMGGVWFQDTNAIGQFHLTSLPRGPIKLMVYGKQEGADRGIKDIRYFDVTPGQTEIRIEMSDANDRLRGID